MDSPVIIQDDVSNALDTLQPELFQLIITSPPYNIGKAYEEQVSLRTYLDWQAGIIEKLVTLLHPTGSICWQVGNYVDDGEVFPLDTYFYHIFKILGMKLRNRIIWHFGHGLHTKYRLSGRYETVLWFTKGDDYVFNLDPIRIPAKYPGKKHFKGPKQGQLSGNPLGKNPSDFWVFLQDEWETGTWEIPNVKSNHCEKTTHPCQFPVELAERCVLAFTNEDDWVLDPFCGAGSSLIAATKHDRRSVGIDCSAEYCEITRQRLNDLQNEQLKTRPIGRPIYDPTSG